MTPTGSISGEGVESAYLKYDKNRVPVVPVMYPVEQASEPIQ